MLDPACDWFGWPAALGASNTKCPVPITTDECGGGEYKHPHTSCWIVLRLALGKEEVQSMGRHE